MKFRLGDEDRQNLGCPEWIEFDENRLKVSEARAVVRNTGVNQGAWAEELSAGNLELICGFVWLALKRIGIDVPYEDLDFDLAAAQMDDGDDEGKAPSQTP